MIHLGRLLVGGRYNMVIIYSKVADTEKERKILAENGGLDVELEPEGVLGSWWKAGAWRLNKDEPLLETPWPEDEL